MTDRENLLAAGRKKLKKFQQRNLPLKASSPAVRAGVRRGLIDQSVSRLSVADESSSQSASSGTASKPLSASVDGSPVQPVHQAQNGSTPQSTPLMNGLDPPPSTIPSQQSSSLTLETCEASASPILTRGPPLHQSKTQGHASLSSVTSPQVEDQLKAQQQTINILVGEKSSLQHLLSQHQLAVQEKQSENAVLSERLTASLQHVQSLEAAVARLSSDEQQQTNSVERHKRKLTELSAALQVAQQESEELRQQTVELASKLNSQATECAQLRSSHGDVSSKLQMAELLVQQLSAGGDVNDLQLSRQRALDEKAQLEQQVSQLSGLLQRTTDERDNVSHRHQQALLQSSQQHQEAQRQLAAYSEECNALRLQLEVHQKSVSELQQQLDRRKDEEAVSGSDDMQQAMRSLAEEKQKLLEDLTNQSQQMQQLQSLSLEQQTRIVQLDQRVTQLTEESADRQQLLASVQADKQIISRVALENKQMRERLEELEGAAGKMSEEKLELSQQVVSEREETQELEDRLQEKTALLRQVQEQLMQAETTIDSLHTENNDLSDQLSRQVQMNNRRQHLEAQGQLADSLQKELAAVQNALQQSLGERQQLESRVKQLMLRQELAEEEADGGASGSDRQQLVAQVESLSSTVERLHAERTHWAEEMEKRTKAYQQQLAALEQESAKRSLQQVQPRKEEINMEGSEDFVPRKQFDSLQQTLSDLQIRFLEVMSEKSDVVQQLQGAQHVAMQLESEADTVGDYIALYHAQREELKERYSAKEELIKRLNVDQANMRVKLEELGRLVLELMADKRNLLAQLGSVNGSVVQQPLLAELQTVDNGASSSQEVTGENGVSHQANTAVDLVADLLEEKKAQKILTLLDDLKKPPALEELANKLAAAQLGVDCYIHCGCCAGRLHHV